MDYPDIFEEEKSFGRITRYKLMSRGDLITFYTFQPVETLKEARKNRLLTDYKKNPAYSVSNGYQEFWDEGEFVSYSYGKV